MNKFLILLLLLCIPILAMDFGGGIGGGISEGVDVLSTGESSGDVLTAQGDGTSQWATPAGGGGGDVSGPGSSTDNAIAVWDGTGGDTLQNSLITLGTIFQSATPGLASIHAISGLGTNIGGAGLDIAPGQSTGLAGGGHIRFQTALLGVTGSALNSLITRIEITDDGVVDFTGSTLKDVEIASGPLILSQGTQNYHFESSGASLNITSQSSGTTTLVGIRTADADGTDLVQFFVFGSGSKFVGMQYQTDDVGLFRAGGVATLRIKHDLNTNTIEFPNSNSAIKITELNITNGPLIFSQGTQEYNVESSGTSFTITGKNPATTTSLHLRSNDADGTDLVQFAVFGSGSKFIGLEYQSGDVGLVRAGGVATMRIKHDSNANKIDIPIGAFPIKIDETEFVEGISIGTGDILLTGSKVIGLNEEITRHIESVAAKTYILVQKAKYSRQITSVVLLCTTGAGTVTVDIEIDAVGVDGCSSISVTDTESDATCTDNATNDLAAGETLELVASSVSSCGDLVAQIETTRD